MFLKTQLIYISFSLLWMLPFIPHAQDANKILLDAYERSLDIKQGYYEATHRLFDGGDTDTNIYRDRFWFKKLPNDNVFGLAFHGNNEEYGEWTSHFLYTGKEFVTGSDTLGTYHSLIALASNIDNIKENLAWYSPFTEGRHSPLPDAKALKKKGTYGTYLGQEHISGQLCNKIKVIYAAEDDLSSEKSVSERSAIFWIDVSSHLVLQYSKNLVTVMNKDTMTHFEMTTIDTCSMDQPLPDNILTMKSLPPDYKFLDLVERETPLPIGTIARDWTLPSLNGQEINLSTLPGKVILIDFFFKACKPCVEAMPVLESLHQKYNNIGLTIVGIDPVDDQNDFLKDFLARQKVTYPVVYGDQQTKEDYHVFGYPTTFLLNRNKRIIWAFTGFGPGLEKALEKIILDNL